MADKLQNFKIEIKILSINDSKFSCSFWFPGSSQYKWNSSRFCSVLEKIYQVNFMIMKIKYSLTEGFPKSKQWTQFIITAVFSGFFCKSHLLQINDDICTGVVVALFEDEYIVSVGSTDKSLFIHVT